MRNAKLARSGRKGTYTAALLVALALQAACSPKSVDTTSASARSMTVHSRLSDLQFSGRFEHSARSSRFSWSGSSISARVVARAVAVELSESVGSNYYYVLIDGEPLPNKLITSPGRRDYVLTTDLEPGEHQITLHRLTEAWIGETEFFAFKLNDGGQFRAPPKPPSRRIEAIGDSITCGYGNEGKAATCPFTPAQENHYLTYTAIAARNLSADLVTVAWSGKGIFSNRGATDDPETIPILWQRTLAERPDSRWNFANYQPHAVIINLGTNDFAPENPNWSPFAESYLTFVREIRSQYPRAHIFCTLGPMLSDNHPPEKRALTLAREGITKTIATLTSAGDKNVHFLEFPEQNDQVGYGCDWHPNLKQHEIMAKQLEGELRGRVGW